MKIKLNFDVLPSSSKTISIYDQSDWSYALNKPSYIQIIPPGSVKCTTLDFTKACVETYFANDITLGCGDLPDGMYTITLQSAYEDIYLTKYYLKTDKLDLNIAKLIIENNEQGNITEAFQNSIFEMKWLLEVAQSYTKEGEYKKAEKYFRQAQNLLNCESCPK